MNASPSRFSLTRLPWAQAICLTVAVAVAQLAIPPATANADIINGVYSSVTEGTTTASNPFVYSGTNFTSVGGEGATSAGLNIYDSMTSGTLYGFSGTQVDSPLLKGISQPSGGNQSTLGYVGAMATYQYDGAVAATITFDWDLTGTLTQPTDTGALIRGKAGLVTGADFFETNINNFFESSAIVEDSMSFVDTGTGTISETGTLSFIANPGEQFHLVMDVQTYGGRNGAIADAFSTFQGNLTSSAGTISAVSSIPEPGSASLLAGLAGLLLLRRRRA